jgi:hypothetical protein
LKSYENAVENCENAVEHSIALENYCQNALENYANAVQNCEKTQLQLFCCKPSVDNVR